MAEGGQQAWHIISALRHLNDQQQLVLNKLNTLEENLFASDDETTTEEEDEEYEGESSSSETSSEVAVVFELVGQERDSAIRQAAELVFWALAGFVSAAVLLPFLLGWWYKA